MPVRRPAENSHWPSSSSVIVAATLARRWKPRCQPDTPWRSTSALGVGKFRRPAQAARFHTVMFAAIFACSAVLFTGIDLDPGHRVLGGVLGDRVAPDLPADPDRRQRSRIHGPICSTGASPMRWRRSTSSSSWTASTRGHPPHDRHGSRPMDHDLPDAPQPEGAAHRCPFPPAGPPDRR